MIEFPYNFGSGERVSSRRWFGEGLTSQIIESGEPLLLNRQGAARGPADRRHSLEVLPRRPDPGRRPRNRRDQRPEHARGRAIRRGRHATARDARRKRGRGDPERAPLRRDRAAEGVLRVARRDQPGRGNRDGRGRAASPAGTRPPRSCSAARPRRRSGGTIDDLVFGDELREEGREITAEAMASGRAQRITRRSAQGRHAGRRRADARAAARSTASAWASSGSTTTSASSSRPARRPRRRRRRRARSWPR